MKYQKTHSFAALTRSISDTSPTRVKIPYARAFHEVIFISSHVKISMISVISGLSLKLYLNSLVYYRYIFGSSWKVFGNLRQSSGIFGNFRKMFGNVRLVFGTILENLRKVSEIFGRSSKTPSSVRLYNKKTIHVSLKI